jgi:hypothetical protein
MIWESCETSELGQARRLCCRFRVLNFVAMSAPDRAAVQVAPKVAAMVAELAAKQAQRSVKSPTAVPYVLTITWTTSRPATGASTERLSVRV